MLVHAMRLTEREARALLLVQAVEDTDGEGVLLPPRTRAAAARRAFDDAPGGTDNQARLRARASLLQEELRREAPVLMRVLDGGRIRRPLVIATVTVSAAIGTATNVLGPERHVSVIAFPLAGIVVWNLVVYAALAARAVAGIVRRARGTGASGSGLALLAGWLEHLRLARLARRLGATARSVAVTAAVERFQHLWAAAAAPLLAARLRVVLHLAAFAMAAGAIGGMYISGIAFEYRATWESTWLDAPAVQRYLDVVLGGAARVMGVRVPDVGPLRGPGAEGAAASWIHLWATTLGLFVLLPRAALALVDAVAVARLSRWLPVDVDPGYARRALHGGRGATDVVEIVYYSCAPGAGLRDRLHARLQEEAGARAVIRDAASLEYGAAPERVTVPEVSGTSGLVVVVFALAQTPELEVHGEFLEGLQARLDAAGWQMAVVLDMETYRQRVGSDQRVRERRATWDRMLRELQITAMEPG